MTDENSKSDEFVKVAFLREQDDEGFPPARWENVWARRRADGLYELDNSPWFAVDASLGDLIEVEPNPAGHPIFKRVAKESGHSTVRAMLSDPDDDEARDVLQKRISELGCTWEGYDSHIYAIDVPPSTLLHAVLDALDEGSERGLWGVETGAISTVHNAEWPSDKS